MEKISNKEKQDFIEAFKIASNEENLFYLNSINIQKETSKYIINLSKRIDQSEQEIIAEISEFLLKIVTEKSRDDNIENFMFGKYHVDDISIPSCKKILDSFTNTFHKLGEIGKLEIFFNELKTLEKPILVLEPLFSWKKDLEANKFLHISEIFKSALIYEDNEDNTHENQVKEFRAWITEGIDNISQNKNEEYDNLNLTLGERCEEFQNYSDYTGLKSIRSKSAIVLSTLANPYNPIDKKTFTITHYNKKNGYVADIIFYDRINKHYLGGSKTSIIDEDARFRRSFYGDKIS